MADLTKALEGRLVFLVRLELYGFFIMAVCALAAVDLVFYAFKEHVRIFRFACNVLWLIFVQRVRLWSVAWLFVW